MNHKIYFTPLPSEPYFTFDEHVRKAVRSKFGALASNDAAAHELLEDLKNDLCRLLNIDRKIRLFVSRPSSLWSLLYKTTKINDPHFINAPYWKEQWESGHADVGEQSEASTVGTFFGSTDVFSGKKLGEEDLKGYTKSIDILDITFTFPAMPELGWQWEAIVIQTNAAMGIPFPLVLMLIDATVPEEHVLWKMNWQDISYFELYMLARITADMADKGLGQIERETKYKGAVINQAIEMASALDTISLSKKSKSANILKAVVNPAIVDVARKLYDRGYVVEDDQRNRKGEQILSISNYPTHSKEQMELLADVIAGF